MLKSLFNYFFNSKASDEENSLLDELRKNPSFRSKKEMEMHPIQNSVPLPESNLQKGEIKTITLPDFGVLNGFILSEWTKKNGEVIQSGEIICVIENEKITMEFESFYTGKLVIIAKEKQPLEKNEVLCMMEGI